MIIKKQILGNHIITIIIRQISWRVKKVRWKGSRGSKLLNFYQNTNHIRLNSTGTDSKISPPPKLCANLGNFGINKDFSLMIKVSQLGKASAEGISRIPPWRISQKKKLMRKKNGCRRRKKDQLLKNKESLLNLYTLVKAVLLIRQESSLSK